MSKLIKLSLGDIEGVEGKYSYSYKGIPYAKPPIGELRFHTPKTPEPWKNVLKADTFSAICPQAKQDENGGYYKEFYYDRAFMPEMSEDCLYLNIWVPKEGEGPFPVAIWFHGGGFVSGFGSEMEFDGEAYAKRGVILVTVNYRLGMLGFFAHPELTLRDGHSGNYGLMDQIASVDWVREHISCFRGDKEQITIFGQSAGGMSVRALVASPLMQGKIKRAIIQSAGGYKGPLKVGIDGAALEKAALRFLRKQKLTLVDLQNMPAQELVKWNKSFTLSALPVTKTLLSLAPCQDGYVLKQSFNKALKDGNIMPIPYMIGCNQNDISAGKNKKPQKNKFYASSQRMCEMLEQQGQISYMYYFMRELPGQKEGTLGGSFHSSELWYMFGTLERCWRPMTKEDEELSERMLDAWTRFIKTGMPGWNAYTKETKHVQLLTI